MIRSSLYPPDYAFTIKFPPGLKTQLAVVQQAAP